MFTGSRAATGEDFVVVGLVAGDDLGGAEAALSSVSFSGTVDTLLTGPNYVNTYDGRTFITGQSMTGYVEYDSVTGETTQLWMDVRDQNNAVYRFNVVSNDGPQLYTPGTGTTPWVFEINGAAGNNALLTHLDLTSLSTGGTGRWYFDYDDGGQSFRILGDAQVSAVPIPAAIYLFGPGLVGLVGLRRRFGK